MGTSISQPSPPTTGWNAVATCFKHDAIPIERTATEIWRAAVHQDNSIRDQLKSPIVYTCLAVSKKAASPHEAAKALNDSIGSGKNTLIAELAKRAVMIKAAGGFPKESAASVLFRQITDYLVARDVAGYVGSSFRCKTFAEIRKFKTSISDVVSQRVARAERGRNRVSADWERTATTILTELQK